MLDYILTCCLIVFFPTYRLWRSFAARRVPAKMKSARYVYIRTIILAFGLVACLAIDWCITGRPASSLGLDIPLSKTGLIALGISAPLMVVLGFMVRSRKSGKSQNDRQSILLPQTRSDLFLFLLFSAIAGMSWELLYRGFLLWTLVPHIGLIASVAVATVAYGLAHGYKNMRQLVVSLVTALVFTLAFALSKSLWWLILIHITLPLLGLLAHWRGVKGPPSDPASLD